MIAEAQTRFTLVGRDGSGRVISGSAKTVLEYSERWFVYVCPVCATETAFEWSEFVKHVGNQSSNLDSIDEHAVQDELENRLGDENAFVDFYCSGCGTGVRAYFYYEPSQDRQYEWLQLKTVVEVRGRARNHQNLELPLGPS